MENSIGIFFGSDTGNTENVAHIIKQEFNSNLVNVFDISQSDKEEIRKYSKLLFGIPTWYYGEAQCDWDDFLPIFEKINFSKKKVAIFGCGDQEDYSEYFCDAMFIVYSIVKSNGAILVGNWPASGYFFKSSKSILSDGNFVGLAIDEDRQPEMTKQRVKNWVRQICKEFNEI